MQRDELLRRYREGPDQLETAARGLSERELDYDEMEFSRRLHYRERPIATSLAAVRAARETSGSILEHLSDADWGRSGVHTDSGAYSVETWLEIYAAHCHDHADQITRAVEESRA